MNKSNSKKLINAWCMYDWANSAYNLVITSTIFPAYYEAVTRNPENGNTVRFLGRDFVNTALYNYALGFAFIVVSILSPILTSIADTRGNKKNFMRFFCTIGSIDFAGHYYIELSIPSSWYYLHGHLMYRILGQPCFL
jgi:UMF1 family MFS transporter